MRRGRALLLGLGIVTGLVTAWSAAVGDRRPAIAGSEWAARLVDACADLRPRVAGVADAATAEALVDELRAQVDGVEAVSGRLRRARPDVAAADAHHQAVGALTRWRATGTGLADRLDRRPTLTVGEVVRGLAADAAAARDADRAVASLAGRPCLALPLDPVDPGSAARAAGEALLDLSRLRRVAESDPACVVAGFEAVPFRVATTLEHGEPGSEAVEALSDVLDRCLHLPALLERIFADLGHERTRAGCLAEEVAPRAGWRGLLETVVDAPSRRFTSATAIALEICA